MWKEGERAKKRLKGEVDEGWVVINEEDEEEEWDEEALEAQFSETVRYSVVNSYTSAITELYSWQFDSKGPPPPPIRGAKLSAILQSVRRDENLRKRVNYVDRGLYTITAGYDIKGLKRAISWCWEAAAITPGSAESYLRTAADHLLGLYYYHLLPGPLTDRPVGHSSVTRGENRRDVQLTDRMLIELEDEGPIPHEAVPCMVITMHQGKMNQFRKVEYMGCLRNINPILCPLSALAFYFFFRWGMDGATSFPSFRQPEDYYELFALPGSVTVPARPLSYRTQWDWEQRMFKAVRIQSKEKTHSARKQAARHAELYGVPESEIRRAGRWNTDALTGVYLSYLPRSFMRTIAGFPKEGRGYFLPRAQHTPDEALCSRIWPVADVWLARMEAYHPDRQDNKVVRCDLTGSGFLRLLHVLQEVLLQDLVVLRVTI